MPQKRKIKINILLACLLTLALPVLLGDILNNYFLGKYINLPLHSALEVSGGMIAIVISMIFYIKYSKNHTLTSFNWSTAALLAMGIIDIFHGIMRPGELFVWLHSCAVFFGGVFFTSVWLKERQVTHELYKLIPVGVIFFSVFFSLFSIIFSGFLPPMLNSDNSFTPFANILNVAGGIGFFLASVRFLLNYINNESMEELLFAGHTMLFGIAGVLFVSSQLWDIQWWLWHVLRVLAYSIALYFLYMEFKKEIKLIEKKNCQLDMANKRIHEYLDIVDNNIITSTTDLNATITNVSDAFCKISGYGRDELIGKNHNIIRHPDMPAKLFRKMWNTLESGKIWEGEIKNRKKEGGYYWVHATISPMFNDKGEKTGYTAIRQDITDKKLIEEISVTDGLTKIYNRRYFNEIFPKVIKSAKRKNGLVSFIIIDVDHFKQYNDTYGHQAGDSALIKVANSIRTSLKRADDYCFRLGGEEFGVIFGSDSKYDAFAFAEKIRDNIKSLKIEHNQNEGIGFITVSMGLVCKRANDIASEDDLYKEADDLLYRSKKTGRNRVSC